MASFLLEDVEGVILIHILSEEAFLRVKEEGVTVFNSIGRDFVFTEPSDIIITTENVTVLPKYQHDRLLEITSIMEILEVLLIGQFLLLPVFCFDAEDLVLQRHVILFEELDEQLLMIDLLENFTFEQALGLHDYWVYFGLELAAFLEEG